MASRETLAQLKNQWHGTLILVGQPSEERVDGARAMLNDNLYARFGKPDYAIALHDDGTLEAGKVGVVSGPALAAVNSVDVTMRGVGSHGARPEASKDPVVLSAEFIMAIQTIVSRQIPPQDPAVVTVGTIHGGTKRNIIPDEVKMGLPSAPSTTTCRSRFSPTSSALPKASPLPAASPPTACRLSPSCRKARPSPTTILNWPTGCARCCVRALGADNVVKSSPEMVSEDFGLFGLEGHQIPTVMLRLGAVAPEKVAESQAHRQASAVAAFRLVRSRCPNRRSAPASSS